MPRRDGTGPVGRAPMNGRGLGPCGGANAGGIGTDTGVGLGGGRRGLRGGRRELGRNFKGTDSSVSIKPQESLQEQKE